jgi:hypothetical protein
MRAGKYAENLYFGQPFKGVIDELAKNDDEVIRLVNSIQKILGRKSYALNPEVRERIEISRLYEKIQPKLMQIVKIAQPRAMPPFASELKNQLTKKNSIREVSEVNFFTTVDSPLDQFGYDGFVEFELKDGSRIIVTLDITLNRNKKNNRSDCVLIVEEGMREGDNAFSRSIDECSDYIINIALSKYNRGQLYSRDMQILEAGQTILNNRGNKLNEQRIQPNKTINRSGRK